MRKICFVGHFGHFIFKRKICLLVSRFVGHFGHLSSGANLFVGVKICWPLQPLCNFISKSKICIVGRQDLIATSTILSSGARFVCWHQDLLATSSHCAILSLGARFVSWSSLGARLRFVGHFDHFILRKICLLAVKIYWSFPLLLNFISWRKICLLAGHFIFRCRIYLLAGHFILRRKICLLAVKICWPLRPLHNFISSSSEKAS